MNPNQLNQQVAQAQQVGNQLQSQYNTQAGQTYGQYQNAYGNAQNVQQGLQDFTKGMVNGNDLYGTNLANAQSMYGFNPQDLLKANQSLSRTATTMANLPQAAQQMGNYYGTTAGQEAGNYAGLAGNLNTVLAGQSNAANAFQNVLNATQSQANQQTGAGLQGQAQQLQGHQAAAQNANQIMSNAAQTMSQIEALQQQQGGMTAQQTQAYYSAYAAYQQAALSAQNIQQLQVMQQPGVDLLNAEARQAAQPVPATTSAPKATASKPSTGNSLLTNIGNAANTALNPLGALTHWLGGL